MSQQNSPEVGAWMNRTVVDRTGGKLGTVTDVYVDDDKQPDWLAVSTGMFGTKVSFVPVAGASLDGDNVMVGYDKDKISNAPRVEPDGALSIDEEERLFDYYGRAYSPTTRTDTVTAPNVTALAGNDGDEAAMVRSEEELSVGKHTEQAGRVKLRKWVETEDVHVTVPVEHQVARLVREPVAAGDARGGEQFVAAEAEITLSKEVVDISKRVVAKERIGVETEVTTEQVAVDETVRKERVEVLGNDLIDETNGARR